MNRPHLIDDLRFETHLDKTGSAHSANNDWPDFCRERLLAVVDRVFDEFSPDDGRVHRLERLEVDLGELSNNLLPEEIEECLEQALRQRLRDCFDVSRVLVDTTGHARVKTLSRADREQEVLEHYLHNGFLPGNAATFRRYPLEQELVRLAERDSGAVGALLLASPGGMERVIRQLDDKALERLLRTLSTDSKPSASPGKSNGTLSREHERPGNTNGLDKRHASWESAFLSVLTANAAKRTASAPGNSADPSYIRDRIDDDTKHAVLHHPEDKDGASQPGFSRLSGELSIQLSSEKTLASQVPAGTGSLFGRIESSTERSLRHDSLEPNPDRTSLQGDDSPDDAGVEAVPKASAADTQAVRAPADPNGTPRPLTNPKQGNPADDQTKQDRHHQDRGSRKAESATFSAKTLEGGFGDSAYTVTPDRDQAVSLSAGADLRETTPHVKLPSPPSTSSSEAEVGESLSPTNGSTGASAPKGPHTEPFRDMPSTPMSTNKGEKVRVESGARSHLPLSLDTSSTKTAESIPIEVTENTDSAQAKAAAESYPFSLEDSQATTEEKPSSTLGQHRESTLVAPDTEFSNAASSDKKSSRRENDDPLQIQDRSSAKREVPESPTNNATSTSFPAGTAPATCNAGATRQLQDGANTPPDEPAPTTTDASPVSAERQDKPERMPTSESAPVYPNASKQKIENQLTSHSGRHPHTEDMPSHDPTGVADTQAPNHLGSPSPASAETSVSDDSMVPPQEHGASASILRSNETTAAKTRDKPKQAVGDDTLDAAKTRLSPTDSGLERPDSPSTRDTHHPNERTAVSDVQRRRQSETQEAEDLPSAGRSRLPTQTESHTPVSSKDRVDIGSLENATPNPAPSTALPTTEEATLNPPSTARTAAQGTARSHAADSTVHRSDIQNDNGALDSHGPNDIVDTDGFATKTRPADPTVEGEQTSDAQTSQVNAQARDTLPVNTGATPTAETFDVVLTPPHTDSPSLAENEDNPNVFPNDPATSDRVRNDTSAEGRNTDATTTAHVRTPPIRAGQTPSPGGLHSERGESVVDGEAQGANEIQGNIAAPTAGVPATSSPSKRYGTQSSSENVSSSDTKLPNATASLPRVPDRTVSSPLREGIPSPSTPVENAREATTADASPAIVSADIDDDLNTTQSLNGGDDHDKSPDASHTVDVEIWRDQVMTRVSGELAKAIERHEKSAADRSDYYRRLLAALEADAPIDPAAIAAQTGHDDAATRTTPSTHPDEQTAPDPSTPTKQAHGSQTNPTAEGEQASDTQTSQVNASARDVLPVDTGTKVGGENSTAEETSDSSHTIDEEIWRSQVMARVSGEFAETIERHGKNAADPSAYYRRLLEALEADEPVDPATIAAKSGLDERAVSDFADPEPSSDPITSEILHNRSWIEGLLSTDSSALQLVMAPLLADTAFVTEATDIWPKDLLEQVFTRLRSAEFETLRPYAETMTLACVWDDEKTRTHRMWSFLAEALFPVPRYTSAPQFVAAYADRIAADAPTMNDFRATLCATLPEGTNTHRTTQYIRYWLLASNRTSRSDRAPTVDRTGISVGNAGLVLLSPYLPHLFEVLGLLQEGKFSTPEQARRACHLLQFTVDERSDAAEHELVLNKLICGLDLRQPLDADITVEEQEKSTIEGMLAACIAHWEALGTASVTGLRETFLQRAGHLTFGADGWRLKVEKKTLDILMERLPWGFSIIRHPWMAQPLFVEWL